MASKSVYDWKAELPLSDFGPFRLVILQATSFCNLDCDYCYLPDRRSKNQLSLELLDPIFKHLFTSRFLGERFTVAWHAGEPMSVPISFYEAAFDRIQQIDKRYNTTGCKVSHSIQTNGTFINQRWCDLIKHHNICLGVSLDGPAFLHNSHRKSLTGMGTHAGVMRGIELLQKNKIDFRVIAVLTQESLDYPNELFNFFIDNGIRRVGFNVEEVEGINHTTSLTQSDTDLRYRNFMKQFWTLVKQHPGTLQIREFERICGLIYSERRIAWNQLCRPFSMVNIDNQGNFTTYSPELLAMKNPTYGDFILGNVKTDTFESVCATDKFKHIYQDIQAGVEQCRQECEYFGLCGGGAPSNKYWENGTFRSTETNSCRYNKKAITDILVEDLEASLGLVQLSTTQI